MQRILKRLGDELSIRGYSPRTVTSYVGAVKLFLIYVAPADVGRLSTDDVRDYLVYLKSTRRVSGSTINQAMAGIRFLFVHILDKPWAQGLRCHKRTRKLPVVLTRNEVSRLLEEVTNRKYRTVLMTLYSTGLRLSEALNLEVRDLDSDAGRVHIRQGKGAKDRYTLLPPLLLDALRSYWWTCRPRTFLFPGKDGRRPLDPRSIQRACGRAAKKAKILKRVTPHTLRHSFATHLLENGVGLPYIQQLLGHQSIQTTMVYLQVTREGMRCVESPLEQLPGVRQLLRGRIDE